MRNRRLFAVGVIALVIATQVAGSAADTSPGVQNAIGALEDDDGPCQAISKFASDRLGTPKVKVRVTDLGFKCELPSNQDLNFIIATIPNPIGSHLQLWFDRALESMLTAVGFVGFRFEGAWIPWDTDLVKEEPDIFKRLVQEKRRSSREKEPGVLLFRAPRKCVSQPPHPTELACMDLIILLVPETPTGGVAEDIFLGATQIARKTSSTLSHRQPNSRVPVLGPSFSGSFSSLAKIMARDRELASRLQVISGTAASSQAWKEAFDGTAASYNTTVHTIDDQFGMLVDHMENVLIQPQTIGMLTESETALGWHFADQKMHSQNTAPSAGEKIEKQIVYRYPRGISRLRSAYGEQELKAVVGAQQQTPAFRRMLGFRLFDIGPSTDSTPTMAKNQTPLSQDAVLEEIARALQHDQVTLAGIVATDVFDALFIARYLRDACPGIRLFTFNSDLLYEKAAEDFPFDGILALSSYPLIPLNENWTGFHRTGEGSAPGKDTIEERTLFPSQAAEGTYNAMRILLVRSNYVLEEVKSEQLAEYFDPTTDCRPAKISDPRPPGCFTPPVWLSVVTRTGYWPLAVRALDESQKHAEMPPPEPPNFLMKCPKNGRMVSWPSPENKSKFGIDALPRIWRNFFVLMVLSMGSYFLSHLWACASGGERQGFTHLNLWPEEDGWLARLCYLLVCSLSLLAFYGFYILPLVSISRYPNSDALRVPAVLAELFFILFLILACSPCLRLSQRGHKPLWPDTWHYRILALSVSFIGFVTGEAVRLFPLRHDAPSMDHEAFFMAYRSIHIDSGVSPILPLLALLAAYFGWGRVHLRRVTLRFERLESLPELGSGPQFKALTKCRDSLDEFVNDPLPLHWRTLGSFALAAGIFLYLLGAVKSFEPVTFDFLVLILLATLYALLFLTWARFLMIWSKFQLFLEELDRHPMRVVFGKLPTATSISPLLQFTARRRYSALVAIRDRLRMLNTSDELGKAVRCFESQFGAVLAQATDGVVVRRTKAGPLLKSLEQINAIIVDELDLGRWREGYAERDAAAKDTGASGAAPSPEDLREQIVALQYRDYIRYILRQLQNLLVFVVSGFVLSMVALHCYPFQSPRIVTTFISVMFLMFGVGVVSVLAQADRDPLLSRIMKTAPGTLSGNFFLKASGYLGLPLITVLGSQFPSWGRFLFSWIWPMLEAMK